MSGSESETKTAEKSQQQRYNTRKRKLSEEKEIIDKDDEIVNEKSDKKLKPEKDAVELELEKLEKKKDDSENDVSVSATDTLETKKVKVKSSVGEASTSEKPINKVVTRSLRKRKLSEEKDEEKVKPETSRKRKEVEEDVEQVEAKRRRLTKSECFCVPFEKKPDYSTDQDAVITVADWRLQSVQSPIELKHEDSNEYDNFEPLEFHGHWDNEGDGTITNNGFTATLMFKNRETPVLVGGPLHEDTYIFEQLHFHWSEDDSSGCEHIFEGKAYSMEAHAVHYNSKYESFKDAVDKHDGLAVVAFFLEATDDFENECFKKLSEAVKNIVKINTSTEVRPDCLTWIKKAAQCKGYYTYQGSLTTEPYFESVTWIIFPKPIHVSKEQVKNFRDMKSTPCEKHNIVNNVRPVQTPQKKLDIIYARSHRLSV